MRPSRITVTASETAAISLSLWEIMIDVIPRPLRPFISRSRFSESSSFSADVGSSRISSLTFFDSAFAISTSCCWPTPRYLIRHVRVDVEAHASEQVAAAAPSFAPVDEPPATISLPRKMFSVTESSGMRASSWWMMTMPALSEDLMSLNAISSPSNTICPP